MWRAFFLSLGIMTLIVGIECLGVQKFVLKGRQESVLVDGVEKFQTSPGTPLTPPDWAPWSFMSTGAVVCLYCFSVPRMVNG